MSNRAALGNFARGVPLAPATPAIDALQVYARLRAAHPATYARLAAPRQCVVCNQHYTDLQNIGVWSCRTHIGVVDSFTQRWTCCDRRSRAGGCRASDHCSADDPPTAKRVSIVPMFVPLEPPPRAEAIVNHGILSHWTVEHLRAEADQQSAANEAIYRQWEANHNAWVVLRADSSPASALPP